jgi:hypothetical protein
MAYIEVTQLALLINIGVYKILNLYPAQRLFGTIIDFCILLVNDLKRQTPQKEF